MGLGGFTFFDSSGSIVKVPSREITHSFTYYIVYMGSLVNLTILYGPPIFFQMILYHFKCTMNTFSCRYCIVQSKLQITVESGFRCMDRASAQVGGKVCLVIFYTFVFKYLYLYGLEVCMASSLWILIQFLILA